MQLLLVRLPTICPVATQWYSFCSSKRCCYTSYPCGVAYGLPVVAVHHGDIQHLRKSRERKIGVHDENVNIRDEAEPH